MRYKKIYDLVDEILEPSISYIKKSRKRESMPFKEIEKIINIFFQRLNIMKQERGFLNMCL